MDYIIDTPCGKIKGVKSKYEGVVAYKGIRYATSNRFELPKLVTYWEGIYDATKYGNCSYQPRSFYNEEENLKKIFYYNEFRKGEVYTYSEDCLFLNIFKKEEVKENDNLPVLVYIHGGGYKGGCGHEKHFDEPVWPLKGVIGVTINYRLGPLGFMALEGLDLNLGLYDQVEALRWVKNNIASFGGDPENITIMGQSAGAMSVQELCNSPLTKGLFNKAVMCSGGGINKILSVSKPEKHYEFNKKVMELTGAKTIEEFKNVPIEKLFDAWENAKKEVKFMGMIYSPVIDGKLVVDNGTNILKANKQHQIPYMIGSTSEDMMVPFMNSMARKWCKAQKVNSYSWFFNHKLPGDNNGAWHSSDLWYFFGTHRYSWRPMSEVDDDLSNKMVDYLMNFVKTGNPNNEGLPIWEPTNKKQKKDMHLGNGIIEMRKTSKLKMWKTLFTNKAVGE